MQNDNIYERKYLKYKQKYLTLKTNQSGGAKKTYTGAGCLILDENNENVLLVMEKRFNWNTIGGKIDWHNYQKNEDIDFILKDSAIREVQEETAFLLNLEQKDLINYVEIDDTMGNFHRTYIVNIPKNKMIDTEKFLQQKNNISDEIKAENHINTVTIKKVNLSELKKQLNICALNDTEYNLDTKKIGSKYNYLCFINGCEMIINRRLRDVINTAVQQKLI